MRMQAFRRSVAAEAAFAAARARTDGGRYGAAAAPRWRALAGIVALHAAALYALVALDVVHVAKPQPRLSVFDVAPEIVPPVEPPPPAPPPPSAAPVASVIDAPVAPPRIVEVAVAAPAPIVVAPAAPPAPKAAAAVGVPGGTGESVVPPDFAGGQLGNAPPRYPAESRRRREQGTVVLRVMVQADGHPGACTVRDSSGHERLDKAALAAVCRWTFVPATRGGVATAWPMDVPIPFVLRS